MGNLNIPFLFQKLPILLRSYIFTFRSLLSILGIFVLFYSIAVLVYVQTIPDLGLTTTFDTKIKKLPPYASENSVHPELGDEVVQVDNVPIQTWSELVKFPIKLAEQGRHLGDPVPVIFRSHTDGSTFEYWTKLRHLPMEDMVPSVLWFFLKFLLFLVGALVLWKRPNDQAAVPFYLLCVVTLGAYMGGYHWAHIATSPGLVLVFIVCAVLLPVVSLHFYWVFPRKKVWLVLHPRAVLAAMYGPPVAYMLLIIALYLRVRWRGLAGASSDEINDALEHLRLGILSYLVVAAAWYLAGVISLVHGFLRAIDSMERNQVKWILIGASTAILPIGYSLYLILYDPAKFGAGGATWPMFGASACLTLAFAISITRYRLMELDKIVSSGIGYFTVSFGAAVVYYFVVFVGTLAFNQVIASPSLHEAVTVSTTALILMALLDLARWRIKKALDRRFFRDKTQLDRTLQRMGQAVQQLVDPPALAQRLLYATTELMGVTRGAVFLRQGDPPIFELVGSVGPTPELTALSSGCPLIEALASGKGIQRTGSGQHSPVQRQLGLLGGEIAQPMLHEGKLIAALVLGSKDLPYKAEDFDLLNAFGQITVLALGSAEGHRTIEQLNKELQSKVEKISEQNRRIMALQTQLRRQSESGSTDDAPPPEPPVLVQPAGIVGSSPVVVQLLGLVRKVSSTDAVVLIRGESGTGKELLARAVHETSGRATKPFVKVHCAALSPGLLESELFGHVKGAFTGAHRDKIGRFELASGGTLFLDEIGDISLEVQTKLLRVLQEKTFERVGSSETIQVDVRILAATHQNLESLIRVGKFREDLFYRLNVFPIQVPSLRQRAEDIGELALFFMRQSAQRCKKDLAGIDDDVLALLKAYAWPGNIRQLENVMERAVVIVEGPTITLNELPAELFQPSLDTGPVFSQSAYPQPVRPQVRPTRSDRDVEERDELLRALAAVDGNKAEAARALGIPRSTLVSRLKKLGLS